MNLLAKMDKMSYDTLWRLQWAIGFYGGALSGRQSVGKIAAVCGIKSKALRNRKDK